MVFRGKHAPYNMCTWSVSALEFVYGKTLHHFFPFWAFLHFLKLLYVFCWVFMLCCLCLLTIFGKYSWSKKLRQILDFISVYLLCVFSCKTLPPSDVYVSDMPVLMYYCPWNALCFPVFEDTVHVLNYSRIITIYPSFYHCSWYLRQWSVACTALCALYIWHGHYSCVHATSIAKGKSYSKLYEIG